MGIASFLVLLHVGNGSLYTFMTTDTGHTRNNYMQNEHDVISRYMFPRKI